MWYAVKMLLASQIENSENDRPLFERNIRLFQAASEAEAIQKAEDAGRTERLAYENERGERVNWKFVRLIEVQDLCEATLFDGIEVFSEMSWSDDEPNRTANS